MSGELTLTVELRILVYAALLSLVLWISYILAAVGQRGLGTVAGYPTGQYGDLPDWAQRACAAHRNLVENLAPFVALVLVAHALGVNNDMTALAVRLFFWARLAHAIVHIAGISWARTLAFVVGWAGCIILFLQITYA